MFDGDLFDDDEFPGGVFSDEIEGGRAGAHLRLGDRGITARTSGGREFFISYSDCDLELGGDSGKMVFCRTPDRELTFFCDDRRFPEALKRAAIGELFDDVDGILSAGSRQRWVSRIGLWVILALCVVLAVGSWYGFVAAARVAVKSVPMAVDQQIGAAALPAVLSEYGEEIRSPEAQKAVQDIVDRLAPHAAIKDVNYRVLIVDSDVINALALPGGTILVFRGLIDTMDSTEQLSAVLAHEMSHVTLRHHLTQIARSVGIVAAIDIVIGDVGGIIALGTEVLESATLNNYSQAQETEADLEGARMMHEAKISPQAMIDMLENLPDGHLPEALSWLATHPDSDQRIKSVEQFLDQVPPREYSPVGARLDDIRKSLDGRQPVEPVDGEKSDNNAVDGPGNADRSIPDTAPERGDNAQD